MDVLSYNEANVLRSDIGSDINELNVDFGSAILGFKERSTLSNVQQFNAPSQQTNTVDDGWFEKKAYRARIPGEIRLKIYYKQADAAGQARILRNGSITIASWALDTTTYLNYVLTTTDFPVAVNDRISVDLANNNNNGIGYCSGMTICFDYVTT